MSLGVAQQWLQFQYSHDMSLAKINTGDQNSKDVKPVIRGIVYTTREPTHKKYSLHLPLSDAQKKEKVKKKTMLQISVFLWTFEII